MDSPELVDAWASEPDAPSASRSPADIRVVVAGDWAMVRTALSCYVASRSNITVLAECGVDEVPTMARRHRPDVLVLAMPDETALAHIRDMIQACPETSVLMLAASPPLVH